MVFASIRKHSEHCDFFASTSRDKKFALRACEKLQKFGEHEQASTRLNFANKSSKGKILRAVKNFNGPFITPNYLLLGDKLFHNIVKLTLLSITITKTPNTIHWWAK